MKYATLLMATALGFDVVAVAVLLIVALALRWPRLMYDSYALSGLMLFALIGMGAALGLAVGGYGRSMLAVSLVFNVAVGAAVAYAGLDLAVEALGLLIVVVNVALTALAYSALKSGRQVALPIIGA